MQLLIKQFQRFAGRQSMRRMRDDAQDVSLGGLEQTVVGNNVNAAYRMFKNQCSQAQLPLLQRRQTWRIKPKHLRQMKQKKWDELAERTEFKRRVEIATEMMTRESQKQSQ
ncbi:hypothetical protein MP228_004894 [Amoeboaphelidium protococcarum]|nr:hypothetical protein MP228_004894 [Amoeboaphelidium protococcarum]